MRRLAAHKLLSLAKEAAAASIGKNGTAAVAAATTASGPQCTAASLAERLASSAAAGTSGRYLATGGYFSARAYQSYASGSGSVRHAGHAHRQYWARAREVLPKRLEWASQAVKPASDWVLGTGYNARIAIINALYAMQSSTHWTRLMYLLLAEAVTRGDPLAWCYSTPITSKEEENLVAAEAADAAAAAAIGKGVFSILRRQLSNLLRLFWLLVLFGPVIAAAPIALNYKRKEWMKLLRRSLERAGPAFIKWGQWAATRADLFPPDLCSELEKLHMQAPAHVFSHTECAVRDAFGFGVNDLFTSFETEPVASGSIGQIHRARLSETGARLTNMTPGALVAVKVRHPGVSEAIERDFALMMAAARLAGKLPALSTLRLEESLKQFAAPLREQVDLAREGYYLHAFNYNFRGEKKVSFPVPLYPLVAPAVLVETFEEGKHISEYVARGPGAPHNSELAVIGARAMLLMLVKDNLVHSDLHPGNILVKLETPGGATGEAALRTVATWLDKASVSC